MSVHDQVSQERYEILIGRYNKFLDTIKDPNQTPVNVFDPLTPKQLQELELIREVSRDLQAKKEEDMRKAAQAKEAKIAAEENATETEERAPVEESKKED